MTVENLIQIIKESGGLPINEWMAISTKKTIVLAFGKDPFCTFDDFNETKDSDLFLVIRTSTSVYIEGIEMTTNCKKMIIKGEENVH